MLSPKIVMECDICGSRNYHLDKSAVSTKRLEQKKFCPKCNKHTLHKETK